VWFLLLELLGGNVPLRGLRQAGTVWTRVAIPGVPPSGQAAYFIIGRSGRKPKRLTTGHLPRYYGSAAEDHRADDPASSAGAGAALKAAPVAPATAR
jgi:hypothetical protein